MYLSTYMITIHILTFLEMQPLSQKPCATGYFCRKFPHSACINWYTFVASCIKYNHNQIYMRTKLKQWPKRQSLLHVLKTTEMSSSTMGNRVCLNGAISRSLQSETMNFFGFPNLHFFFISSFELGLYT